MEERMKIAILTNFQEFNPGYSLTGIVLDQIQMFIEYGHEVHLLVNEQYNPHYDHYIKQRIDVTNPKFKLSKVVTFGHLKDYTTMMNWSKDHQHMSVKVGNMLVDYFDKYEINLALTHDWIFTGWNLPYAGGVRFASVLRPKIGWLHWVHSVPSVMRDWWQLNNYGPQHRIVFPNKTDQRRVAEQFRTTEDNVFVIPHIKDPRVWFEMDKVSQEFINEHPAVMSAEMVQVYPASSDRLSAKGIDQLITIFSAWKRHGISVCLVIANQWATGKQRKEDLQHYYRLAEHAGLEKDKEFIFTSEWRQEYATGISTSILRDLGQLGSVFVFPTREESFGLVGPEAVLNGVLPVFNGSLTMMRELYGAKGMYFDFGSFHHNMEPQQGCGQYLEAVAMVIYHKFKTDSAASVKAHVRQTYNFNNLYRSAYLPAISDITAVALQIKQDPNMVQEVVKAMEKFDKEMSEPEPDNVVDMIKGETNDAAD